MQRVVRTGRGGDAAMERRCSGGCLAMNSQISARKSDSGGGNARWVRGEKAVMENMERCTHDSMNRGPGV